MFERATEAFWKVTYAAAAAHNLLKRRDTDVLWASDAVSENLSGCSAGVKSQHMAHHTSGTLRIRFVSLLWLFSARPCNASIE